MKTISPDVLYRYNYSVQPINSLRQYWRTNRAFSCIGKPKAQNIFVYLSGCRAMYTDAAGKETVAEAGSLIYAPEGAEYSARFDRFESEDACTVGINFRLFDENMEPIVLGNEIKAYRSVPFSALVEKIDAADKGSVPCYAAMKSGLYDMISVLGSRRNVLDGKFKVICRGIESLEGGNLSMSVEEIAEMCNVSESYFRRLFKEYAGVSPVQYRMQIRISKAKDYLCRTDLNSSEIADLLLFRDASFFCRYFKAVTGMTPAQFRKTQRA